MMSCVKKEGKKMNELLIELGAVAAIVELLFWCGVLFIMYKHNRKDKNVQ